MSQLLSFLVHGFQPLVVPICFVATWAFMALVVWSTWAMLRDTVKQAAHLHQIPCANCRFFTGEYQLKCTVHPSMAMSETAINCPDYQVRTNPFTAASTHSLSKDGTTKLKAGVR